MTATTLDSISWMGRPKTLDRQRLGGVSAKAAVAAILVGALVVAAALFCVWSRTEIIRQGYAFSEMAEEIKGLTGEQEQLRAEQLRLLGSERLEAIAVERLGLVRPGSERTRVVALGGDRQLLAARDAAPNP